MGSSIKKKKKNRTTIERSNIADEWACNKGFGGRPTPMVGHAQELHIRYIYLAFTTIARSPKVG